MTIPDRIIRLRTVLESTGLSRSTVYRKIAEGAFPAQIKLGVHGAGWHESEINRWIADPTGWRARSRGESSKAFAARPRLLKHVRRTQCNFIGASGEAPIICSCQNLDEIYASMTWS